MGANLPIFWVKITKCKPTPNMGISMIPSPTNDPICSCVFMRRSKFFMIVFIYVDNLNIIRNLVKLQNVVKLLKENLR